MAYEYFYPGTPYTLEPSYGKNVFTGYTEQLSNLGLTTDPRTAAKVAEVSNKLNTGLKVIEVSAISPEIFESIPQQHLKEIKRISELTGSEATLHGPLIEASGYTREGWSEANRQGAARQMAQVIERAHEMDKNGNIPVTFHSSAMLPEALEREMTKEGEKPKAMLIVDPRTGDIRPLKETQRFFPGEKSEFNPEEELKRMNKDVWTDNIGNINFQALRAGDLLRQIDERKERLFPGIGEKELPEAKKFLFEKYAENIKNPDQFEKTPEDIKKAYEEEFREFDHASIFLKESYRGLRQLYNMAYQQAKEKDKAKLNAYAKEITPFVKNGLEEPENLEKFAEVIQKGIKVLNSIESPTIFKPLNDFLIDKSAETFASAALHGYKKFGTSAPVVSIENPPAGSALSRAEELSKLIKTSQDKFVEQAKKEGYSESAARDASKKLIGATWDVGHINMLRKHGYEKKHLLEQAEIIAPYAKHVHLSDNFGYEHTELPMGMGNVPIKEIMEKLSKEGFKGKKIIEAAQWWQHMKTAPVVPTLEAFGSPLYPMLAQPNWTYASATYGSYFGFPSSYLPEQHFSSLYGGGFSTLPQELGGQMPGKQSRVTGTPMD